MTKRVLTAAAVLALSLGMTSAAFAAEPAEGNSTSIANETTAAPSKSTSIGQDIKEGATDVGHMAKDAATETGHFFRDAAKDTLDIMKVEHNGATGGVIHCFSYGVEMAREYLNMGYYLGIGGVLTFKNAKKLIEVAEYAPLDRIVLETDCPYLAPVPNRGKRNSSLNLPYVVEEISRIKDVPAEQIIEITNRNAKQMYRIEK